MLKVFVYGTLKPKEANYEAFCGDKVIEAKRAYTFGTLYHLPTYGYPAMKKGNEKVEGFLLTFADEKVLKNLDTLEGHEEGRLPSKNEYNREIVAIYTQEGAFLDYAWVYYMTEEKIKQKGGILVPSGWWVGNN